jgi:hypothetical protein
MKRKLSMTLLLAVCLGLISLYGQETRPAITPADYTKWQNLGSSSISDDGKWISWSIRMVDGDDSLFIKNTGSGKLYSYSLSSGVSFSSDSKWASMRIGYSEKETEKMVEQKKPIRFKTRLLNLADGTEKVFENVESAYFTKESSHLILSGYAGDKRTRDLFLCHLASGRVKNIGNVAESSVNKPGNRLAYIISAEDRKGNGVELLNLSDYSVMFIDNDTATYRSLVWETEGGALAFLKEYKDTAYTESNFKLYTVRNILTKPDIKIFDPAVSEAIPAGMRISEAFRPSWSKDMKTIFFGVYTWTAKPPKGKNDKPAADSKLPGLDIWHWKDDPVQPRQKINYNSDNSFTYLFAWNIDPDKTVRITDEELTRASVTGDGRHALVMNTTLYKPFFREELYDYYITNTLTGEKKIILEQFSSVYGSSPDGKFILYFKDKSWWVYDIYKSLHINLTAQVPSLFWNTRDDSPKEVKPPFGISGWMKEDKGLLVNDEYDVWRIPTDGTKAVRLTAGKESSVVYRLTRIDTEDNFIDPAKDMYFTAFGDIDKKRGYFRIPVKGKAGMLIYEDRSIAGLAKAKNSDTFIYRAETASESPNVFQQGMPLPHP